MLIAARTGIGGRDKSGHDQESDEDSSSHGVHAAA